MKTLILIFFSTTLLFAQWPLIFYGDDVTVDTISTTNTIDKDFELSELISNNSFDSNIPVIGFTEVLSKL